MHHAAAAAAAAAAAGAAAGHVGLLVCDFDDTITEKDTIGALMAAAVEANVKVSNRQPLSMTVHNTMSAHYQHVATAFSCDHGGYRPGEQKQPSKASMQEQ
jgi:hypothetical protein